MYNILEIADTAYDSENITTICQVDSLDSAFDVVREAFISKNFTTFNNPNAPKLVKSMAESNIDWAKIVKLDINDFGIVTFDGIVFESSIYKILKV